MSASDGVRATFVGQTVWVTGAASGIGAHLTITFAGAGARVAAIDIDEQALLTLRRRSDVNSITTAAFDVASWEATSKNVELLIDRLGPPSVVIANAGIAPAWVPVAVADPAEWSRVLAVNLTGAFHVAKAASPYLCETAPSSLLFMSSVMGLGAGPGGAAYQASKHGVIGLMRTLANELAGAGVRVNALCPAWVNTPMLDADIEQAGSEREAGVKLRVGQHLLRRLIEPEDVAQAAMFLASPAGGAITAVALPVDAGMLEQRHWLSREAGTAAATGGDRSCTPTRAR